MGVAITISVLIMLGMMYLGLWLVTEWDGERKLHGWCTLAWMSVAVFLLLFKWMPDSRHEILGLTAITFLSTAGYIVGKTLSLIFRRDYTIEDFQPAPIRRD